MPSVTLASRGFKLNYRDALYLNSSRKFLSIDEESAKRNEELSFAKDKKNTEAARPIKTDKS